MTNTIDRRDVGEGTQNLTYLLQPPVLRRSDATGEQPIYHPKTIAVVDPTGETLLRPVGIEELARLSAGETLVLPTDAAAHAPRHAVPTVYQAEEQPETRPERYRGKRRAAAPPWVWALVGAGALAFGEVVGLVLLAVVR